MSTVYVKNINSFDADLNYIVQFGYSGNQCIANEIKVYNNATNALVFSEKTTTFSLSHTIPSATLSNGVSYYCTITAYYLVSEVENSITSSASVVWTCFTTPTWEFVGISSGSTINNSYYELSMNYSQLEGETVEEFQIVFYNSAGSVFWSSGTLYDTLTPVTITDLENDTAYYVRAYGTTTHGMTLDTRVAGVDLLVNVDYIQPSTYSLATLENDKWHGWVKITTYVVGIDGHSGSGLDIVYIDNRYADLQTLTESVVFNEGFLLDNDYIIQGRLYGMLVNQPSVNITGESLSLSISFNSGTFSDGEKFYASLSIPSSNYYITSNFLSVPNANDTIHFWLSRENGLFALIISNLGVAE